MAALDALLFLVSLAVTLAAAAFFARRLDRVGLRLGLPETLLGLLTALAADAPEASSAIAALVKGEHGVGVGVILGSNVFNLAAMVGFSALLCGSIRIRREALAVEGVVGLAATLVAGSLVLGWIDAWVALVLLAVVLVPYVTLLALGPAFLWLSCGALGLVAVAIILGEVKPRVVAPVLQNNGASGGFSWAST